MRLVLVLGLFAGLVSVGFAAHAEDRFLVYPKLEKCEKRFKEAQYKGRNFFYSGNDPDLKETRLDWLDSRNTCRERCMETMTFDTQEKFDFFKDYIERANISFIWTSGRLCDFEGCEGRWDLLPKRIKGWLWSASQIAISETNKIPPGWTYQPWSFTGIKKKPQPDNAEYYISQTGESCLGVLNNMYNDSVAWHDIACYHKTKFICEDSEELYEEAKERAATGADIEEISTTAEPKIVREAPVIAPRKTTLKPVQEKVKQKLEQAEKPKKADLKGKGKENLNDAVIGESEQKSEIQETTEATTPAREEKRRVQATTTVVTTTASILLNQINDSQRDEKSSKAEEIAESPTTVASTKAARFPNRRKEVQLEEKSPESEEIVASSSTKPSTTAAKFPNRRKEVQLEEKSPESEETVASSTTRPSTTAAKFPNRRKEVQLEEKSPESEEIVASSTTKPSTTAAKFPNRRKEVQLEEKSPESEETVASSTTKPSTTAAKFPNRRKEVQLEEKSPESMEIIASSTTVASTTVSRFLTRRKEVQKEQKSSEEKETEIESTSSASPSASKFLNRRKEVKLGKKAPEEKEIVASSPTVTSTTASRFLNRRKGFRSEVKATPAPAPDTAKEAQSEEKESPVPIAKKKTQTIEKESPEPGRRRKVLRKKVKPEIVKSEAVETREETTEAAVSKTTEKENRETFNLTDDAKVVDAVIEEPESIETTTTTEASSSTARASRPRGRRIQQRS